MGEGIGITTFRIASYFFADGFGGPTTKKPAAKIGPKPQANHRYMVHWSDVSGLLQLKMDFIGRVLRDRPGVGVGLAESGKTGIKTGDEPRKSAGISKTSTYRSHLRWLIQ